MNAIVFQNQDGRLKFKPIRLQHEYDVIGKLRIQDGGAYGSRPCWKTAQQPRQRTWDRSHRFPWRPEMLNK